MTPRQKRLYRAGLEKAASARRKSWLGRFTPLTGIQSGWIKSLLSVWGECVGGKTKAQYRLENARRFWSEVSQSEWSDSQLARFTAALEQARGEGFKGAQVALRARAILWPVTLSELIEESAKQDDAGFMEEVMLETFSAADPVYIVGMRYYTTRRKIADIARELQQVAPWLTNREARERVRWCLEIFRAKVFLTARRKTKEPQ